jgi:hypothetical protein
MLIMKWTEEENEIIISNKLTGLSYVEIAKLLPNRTYQTVRTQGFKLLGAINKKSPWLEEEESELLVLRDLEYTYPEIAEILGRTRDSVAIKVQNLIKEGRTSPKLTNSYTREQLLGVVKQYKKVTLCPYDKLYHIKKEFGSWSNAANEAGIKVTGLHPDFNTTLYLLDFGEFYKIGITQQSIKKRFHGVGLEYTVLDYLDTTLQEAKELERILLDNVKEYSYKPEELKHNGSTECFKTEKQLTAFEELL